MRLMAEGAEENSTPAWQAVWQPRRLRPAGFGATLLRKLHLRSNGGESGTLTQRTTLSKNHYKLRLFSTAGGGRVPPVCTTFLAKKASFLERRELFCI